LALGAAIAEGARMMLFAGAALVVLVLVDLLDRSTKTAR
jgi:hypothetical protein